MSKDDRFWRLENELKEIDTVTNLPKKKNFEEVFEKNPVKREIIPFLSKGIDYLDEEENNKLFDIGYMSKEMEKRQKPNRIDPKYNTTDGILLSRLLKRVDEYITGFSKNDIVYLYRGRSLKGDKPAIHIGIFDELFAESFVDKNYNGEMNVRKFIYTMMYVINESVQKLSKSRNDIWTRLRKIYEDLETISRYKSCFIYYEIERCQSSAFQVSDSIAQLVYDNKEYIKSLVLSFASSCNNLNINREYLKDIIADTMDKLFDRFNPNNRTESNISVNHIEDPCKNDISLIEYVEAPFSHASHVKRENPVFK